MSAEFEIGASVVVSGGKVGTVERVIADDPFVGTILSVEVDGVPVSFYETQLSALAQEEP